jgi:hypothetical protein
LGAIALFVAKFLIQDVCIKYFRISELAPFTIVRCAIVNDGSLEHEVKAVLLGIYFAFSIVTLEL